MEFKVGDYVVITQKEHKLTGMIGRIKRVFFLEKLGGESSYGVEIIKGKMNGFFDSDFRHATRQEAAHAIAEEICDGE